MYTRTYNYSLQEKEVPLAKKETQGPLVPVCVVQCTPGGGGPHVQTSLEHNSYMLEELPEVGLTIREGQLTTFVYQMNQATYSTDLVLKPFEITYMVQSMRPEMDHSHHFMMKMCRVLCVTFPPGEQC